MNAQTPVKAAKLLPRIALQRSVDLAFAGAVGTSVPPWPTPQTPPDDNIQRRYVLSMKPSGTKLNIYFSERPSDPDPTGDGPLEMRVPHACSILLALDTGWSWEFAHTDAITLGPMVGAPRYFNLVPNIDPITGRCMSLTFHAEYYVDPTYSNTDQINITVALDQDGTGPVATTFDPDIKNPGDDP